MSTEVEAAGVNLDVARRLIERLNERYADAVDRKDMDAWLACFSTHAAYYVIGSDNDADDLPLCLMMDDCHERLVDRVTFVDKVWKGSYEDYQTRHMVQLLALEPEGDDILTARSNLVVFSTDLKGRTGIFVAGQYRDRVRIERDEALLVERRVVMDTFATPGVVVYPL